MKAIVWCGVGDIQLRDVPEPRVAQPTDAIVRLTSSAICGTDLHFVRGTVPGMKPGRILGHEGVGVIDALGDDVRNFTVGDRVVVPSTIACGVCSYCRAGYFAQCDRANPHGPLAGTAFYGGPETAGGFDGMQAEKVRVPYAMVNLVKLPDDVSDDEAILLSDIFPTGYFGADMADIKPGKTVVVFGCGPVGQFAIASARHLGAGRVFAVDRIPSRLAMARAQGAEVIDFEREDPVDVIRRLTGGIGVDRAIDAVGVDAEHADHGPAAKQAAQRQAENEAEVKKVAPRRAPGPGWQPGHAPAQVLEWASQAVAKAGTLSIVGVYPETLEAFPIGTAMNRNLTVRMGNCHHRRYIPKLIELIRSGAIEPAAILTQSEPLAAAIDAYHAFDERQPGWLKVRLEPGASTH
jgi:threonine dehydrogenase-like Zn-dependent dehydrogenase